MRRTFVGSLLVVLCIAAVVHGGSRILAAEPTANGAVPNQQVKAFPSAEGFGAETRGAYGKAGMTPNVYKVTTLEDPAARAATFDGSFRWAIEAPEPRVIVIAVSGDIVIKKPLAVANPYVTIAGQTAPGDGICLRNDSNYGGRTLLIATHDVVVRHLRVRPGRCNPGVKASSQVAIQVGNSKTPTYNVILDHCSGTWGIDGCMQTAVAQDVTFQWCIISEGLNLAGHDKGRHSRGLSCYVGKGVDFDKNGRFTFHHNLMSHVQYRAPQISTKLGLTEVINNVTYHTTQIAMNINADAHDHPGESKNRFVKNYLLRTADKRGDVSIASGHLPGVLVHVLGNLGPGRGDDSLADHLSLEAAPMADCPVCNATNPPSQRNHWTKDPLCSDTQGVAFPYPKFRVTEDDNAKVTLARISEADDFAGKPSVGTTKPTRDAADARILRQLTDYVANPKNPKTVPVPGGAGGGLLDDPAQVGGYPKLAGGNAPVDTDGDGIPDAWEIAHQLDSKAARDAHQTAANGYSNLENYLNEMAGDTLR